MRYALILAATLCCSLASAAEVKNKGHIIFDVQNAIDHLKDVQKWQKNDFKSLPVVQGDPTTASLAQFLKDEGTSWVAVKALGGANPLHQFSKALQAECSKNGIQLVPMVMPIFNSPQSAQNQGKAAKSLLDVHKTLLVMPTDSFYTSSTVNDVATYLQFAFDGLGPECRFIYSPEMASGTKVENNRAQIHKAFTKKDKDQDLERCSAVMPRMYWLKRNVPNDTLKPDDKFVKRSVKEWAKSSTLRSWNGPLVLLGQVQQEYCDEIKQMHHKVYCTSCGLYGLQPEKPKDLLSGVQMFMENVVNSKDNGNDKPKKFNAVGAAFWCFENFNPLEHQQFESAHIDN